MDNNKRRFYLKLSAIWKIITRNDFLLVSSRFKNLGRMELEVTSTYCLLDKEIDSVAAEIFTAATIGHKQHYQKAIVDEAKEILKCS